MTSSSQEPPAPDRPGPPEFPGERIELGALAQDTRLDRVGVVVSLDGPAYRLRPVRGGVAWDVRPEHVRPISASDLLREKVRQVNRRSATGLS
ncbi:hypothetical protein [Streptomyces litchfieldiae]|uniref:Uncharacterized protein n=1 Tax=Streptomyces litchfieldiae TaxID=3075543 RepID=A0ABU2N0I4_9ACTN|nr:hypothetical protein [Streptomyces sp. DSM 44938]MDT0347038.1 hypothetical protein [Streptomyces sp. DSM 44938]